MLAVDTADSCGGTSQRADEGGGVGLGELHGYAMLAVDTVDRFDRPAVVLDEELQKVAMRPSREKRSFLPPAK